LGRLVGVDVPQGSGVLWVFALPDNELHEVPRPTRRDQPRRSLAGDVTHLRDIAIGTPAP
jgi:hypothetical protein